MATFLLAAHWLIVVGLAIRVITRRPPVGVSLAWLAVIFSVPFVGAALYLMFGEKRLGRRRAARIAANIGTVQQWQSALRAQYDNVLSQISPAAQPLERHAERTLGMPALGGNRIELFSDFQSIFDAIIADIDAAQAKCHAAFYIWYEGGRVTDVVDALIRAAGRGVNCRVMADAMGSKAFFKGTQVKRLRAAGVAFIPALPTGVLRSLFVRADLRNHRKILVIDDRVAYTGSQNLVDPRFFEQNKGVGQWVDAMVRVTGPAAASLDGVFQLDWAVETGQAFEAPPPQPVGAEPPGPSIVQIVPSGPALRPEAIHQLLLSAIYASRRELIMTTPYFVPDEAMVTALESAALRGVAVTLIVPEHNNSMLVRYASAAQFDDLMCAGVNIALFKGGLLHTKSLSVDGEMSVFGSVNLDMRSLWLNFEISMFAYCPEFTVRLRQLQQTYIDDSDRLSLDAWRRRPFSQRFAEDTMRLLSPLL